MCCAMCCVLCVRFVFVQYALHYDSWFGFRCFERYKYLHKLLGILVKTTKNKPIYPDNSHDLVSVMLPSQNLSLRS